MLTIWKLEKERNQKYEDVVGSGCLFSTVKYQKLKIGSRKCCFNKFRNTDCLTKIDIKNLPLKKLKPPEK